MENKEVLTKMYTKGRMYTHVHTKACIYTHTLYINQLGERNWIKHHIE